jgi:hypothetical protein
MPADVQEILTTCEKEGKTETPQYEAATNEFNKRHSCRLDPIPKELAEPRAGLDGGTYGRDDYVWGKRLRCYWLIEELGC